MRRSAMAKSKSRSKSTGLSWFARASKFFLDTVTTYWPFAVAVVPAVGAGIWSYLTEHSYVETSLLLLWTFVGVMLSIASVLWLRDRRRAQLVQIQHDVSYGLAYQNLQVGLDPHTDAKFFQLSVIVLNVSNRALAFEVTQFDVIVGNRTIAKPNWVNRGVIVPRSMSRVYRYPAFSKNDMQGVIGTATEATAEFVIDYGLVGEQSTRRLHMKLDISLMLTDQSAAVADLIAFESECEISDKRA